MRVERRLELRFNPDARKAETPGNLSAIRLDGPCLWVAGDETATIERLTLRDGRYDDHRSFPLAEFAELPAGPGEEADIEGLARDGDWLWAVGSHSRKRKRIKASHSPEKARKRLAAVLREENRYVLVRLPVVEGDDGLPAPVRTDGHRRAAILAGPGHNLADTLSRDPHLAPFLTVPGKDNGFDIEGVAARGDRLYIGLRGPVLRGWAVLLEIRPETDAQHPDRLRLAPIDTGGGPEGQGGGKKTQPYRTHFLDLGGLGIRDLSRYGDDLLILAGPSMDLDGPVRVLRWRDTADADAPAVIPARDLERLTDLPFGHGVDHPEGIAVIDDGPRLLVVYDSPAPDRRTEHGVYADVITAAG